MTCETTHRIYLPKMKYFSAAFFLSLQFSIGTSFKVTIFLRHGMPFCLSLRLERICFSINHSESIPLFQILPRNVPFICFIPTYHVYRIRIFHPCAVIVHRCFAIILVTSILRQQNTFLKISHLQRT